MKIFSLALLLLSLNAEAYVSLQGNDPNLGTYDAEYKSVVKSSAATYSDAISKGMALFYEDDALTGLSTVSRNYSGTANSATGVKYHACIAGRDVATGDTAAFPCVVKGYVDYAYYAAVVAPGAPIHTGDYLCINNLSTAKGYLIPCGSGVSSSIMALEDKLSTGTGTIKIAIQSK